MARLNDTAQWIVLMGFVVSFSLFFIAIVLNQSTVIGQSTSEAVSEFPKNEIRGVKDVIIQSEFLDNAAPFENKTNVRNELKTLSLERQNAVLDFTSWQPGGSDSHTYIDIHYNNGVMIYNETLRL